MADPNDPWAAFNPQAAPATGAMGSRPIISQPAPQPTPQTPAQAEGDALSNEQKRRELNKPTIIPQGATQMMTPDGQVVPIPGAAESKQKQNAEGLLRAAGVDLAKGIDPIADLIRGSTSGPLQHLGAEAYSITGNATPGMQNIGKLKTIVSDMVLQLTGGGLGNQVSDADREFIIERVGNLADPDVPADQRLAAWEQVKQRMGNILGIQQRTGRAQTIPMGAGEFGGRKDIPPLNPQQQAAYDAFTAAHPNASSDQIKSFFSAIGFDVQNAEAVAKAAQEGAGFRPASDAILKPDITDVRGGQNTGTQDALNAGVRGVGDVITMGALDKAVAAGDTIFKGGTFDQNLARQYAISDFDQANHPFARFGGQALGGAILPMGDVNTLGNLALKGAGYGAAYGAGSSRSLNDVPVNTLLGAGAGAAVPLVLGGVGKAVNALRGNPGEIPPLVDPQTGELNQVLDAMPSAQRVQAMKDTGIQTITPGMAGGRTARVLEQGFNNLPASAGTMEDINSAASGELRRAMQGVAQKFGTSKTLNEGGAELQRGARQYIDRAKAVAAKAYDAIPISGDAPASTSATVATLEGLTQKFGSNPELAAQMNSPQIQNMLDAIKGKGLSWQDLKALRTSIGERIGERRFSDDTGTSDLRAVYAALSADMQNTAAAMGPRAQQAFNRANNLYRNTQQVIDNSLVTILGNDAAKSPEKAAAAVQAMTKGGKSTGDLKTLAQIRAATVKSGAWDEIASTLIHLGGQPAGSPGRAFQPQTFVNWYSDMSEPARVMLFKPELRKSLDQFVAVNQQLARLKGLNNTSQTAPVIFGGGALLTGAGTLLNPILGAKMAGALGLNYLMGKIWTNPTFVRLATGYTRALASGNENAVRSQVGRLQKLATTNPELREGVETILRNIANDNTVSQVVASPDAQGNQQQ